ncbi:MAG: hypothetical protein JW984_13735 [Deltaproteobacteria bacterium]|uniref:Uncharacterized protein n=1 Tax=Candidatus Zymogenus saltonus TaxID=2844893 RepID=A0A9D8KGH6_9DELT|nr:hypothetical protein [Candidatus Zymogenus saltonus]
MKFLQKHVYTVITDAAQLQKKYEDAKKQASEAKLNKDIESVETERAHFKEYEKAGKELVEIKDEILKYYTQLVKFDKTSKREKNIIFIYGFLSSGIIALLFYLLSRM